MARLFLSMLVLGEYDTTWLYSSGFMWSIIEVSTGIVCTCLPTMRVLVKAAFGGRLARLLGMSSGKTSQQYAASTAPWTRNNEYYNEIGNTGRKKGTLAGNQTAVTGSQPHEAEWDANSQQILVTEEVDVEMQPVQTASLKM